MKSFTSINKFLLTVKGIERRVFAVENDVYRDEENGLRHFSDFYPEVKINGKMYKVVGVEAFTKTYLEEGSPLGIVVEE